MAYPFDVSWQRAPIAHGGGVFFVNSTDTNNKADDPSHGSQVKPFATWSYAISRATANNHDVIYLMPGHAETIPAAAGVAYNVAGVTTVGLGEGAYRPTFTFNTSTAASVLISAANARIRNIVGIPGIADVTQPFDITGNDCDLELEWQDASAATSARRAVLATSVSRLRLKLKYLSLTTATKTVNAVQLNGCTHVGLDLDAYGNPAAWVQLVSAASSNVKVTGSAYAYGITDGSAIVRDVVGGSTWSADVFDMGAGTRLTGGSGAVLAPASLRSVDVRNVLTSMGLDQVGIDVTQIWLEIQELQAFMAQEFGEFT